jgi:hypothetical protein
MIEMATIITLVTLAAAVLNICLFFKLWGMCGDVRRMMRMMEQKWQFMHKEDEPKPTLRV